MPTANRYIFHNSRRYSYFLLTKLKGWMRGMLSTLSNKGWKRQRLCVNKHWRDMRRCLDGEEKIIPAKILVTLFRLQGKLEEAKAMFQWIQAVHTSTAQPQESQRYLS
jgi:hypothetical protein